MATTAAVNFEVARIDSYNFAIPLLLTHRNDTRVRQVHRLIVVFANQFAARA